MIQRNKDLLEIINKSDVLEKITPFYEKTTNYHQYMARYFDDFAEEYSFNSGCLYSFNKNNVGVENCDRENVEVFAKNLYYELKNYKYDKTIEFLTEIQDYVERIEDICQRFF